MKALIGLALILAGMVAAWFAFANTAYTPAEAPWWTVPALLGGLLVAIAGIVFIGWWIVGALL